MHTAGHSVRLVGHSSTVRPFPDSAVNRPEPAFHETATYTSHWIGAALSIRKTARPKIVHLYGMSI